MSEKWYVLVGLELLTAVESQTLRASEIQRRYTFYGGYCYMPLFVFEGVSGKLMLPLLRPGRTNKRTNVFRLIRFIVTDMYWYAPQHLYEIVYCKRADCELYIKEIKDGASESYC